MSCKTMNIDLANVPPVPIQIGVAGENAFRTITFDASTWGADFPDATYTVVYKRSDGYIYPVLVNAAADAIVWSPTDTDTAVSGNGQIEVRLLDGETIGKTIVMQTFVAPSLSGDESEPSTPAPDWVNDVAADADRAEAAVSHYPQIRNDYWWVWDAENGEWVNTGVKATGEGGDSETVIVTIDDTTDPMTASMNSTEIKAAVDAAKRVIVRYDGSDIPYLIQADTISVFSTTVNFGTPASVAILVSANAAVDVLLTDLVQSVNGMTGAVTLSASDVGAYVKPSGGIPASDLASGVIPSVPQMATDPDMEDWTSGKTVDAATLKTDFNLALLDLDDLHVNKADKDEIPSLTGYATETWVEGKGYQTAQDVQTAISGVRQLPTVTASDNGKFLRVVSGAWAAATVPAAESNSFGGGS